VEEEGFLAFDSSGMKNLKTSVVLDFFDQPLLLHAQDSVGTNFLCVIAETPNGEASARYLCVAISPAKLNAYLHGEVDLRAIFDHPEADEWYITDHGKAVDVEKGFAIIPVAREQLQRDWLPSEGAFYSLPAVSADEIVNETREQRTAVIRLSLDPPESRIEQRILATHLSELLLNFQLFVKHAYLKSFSDGSRPQREAKHSPASELEVFAISPGSFTVHLRSREDADMYGHAEVGRALRMLDEITAEVDDPEKALIVLRRNRGRVATAYIRLLETIVRTESPLSYAWATPELAVPQVRRITTRQAKPLFETLSRVKDLGIETKTLVGTLVSADSVKNTWTLRGEDKRYYKGQVHPASRITMGVGGFTLGRKYRFVCDEIVREIAGTGSESTHYLLISSESLS